MMIDEHQYAKLNFSRASFALHFITEIGKNKSDTGDAFSPLIHSNVRFKIIILNLKDNEIKKTKEVEWTKKNYKQICNKYTHYMV